MDELRWQLELTRQTRRGLERLPPDTQRRVVAALDGLVAVPRTGDIKKLSGSTDEFRLRVGDWRVIYRPDTDHRVVVILAVSHRRDACRNWPHRNWPLTAATPAPAAGTSPGRRSRSATP